MSIWRLYFQLLKGSPNQVREVWETAVFRGGLILAAILVVSPEIAKSIKNTWDGKPRWWAFLPLCIALVVRMARNNFHSFQQLQDKLKVHFGPLLIPIKCQAETSQLIEQGAASPHDTCTGFVVRFKNDPHSPDPSAHANDVLAEMSYFADGRELVTVYGRWGETEQQWRDSLRFRNSRLWACKM